MRLHYFAALLMVTNSSVVYGQTPVFNEPQAFHFENYSNSIVKIYTGLPGVNLPVSSNYTNPINTQVTNPSMWVIEKHNIPPVGASAEELRKYADEDIRRHELEIKQEQDRINEANVALGEMRIDYEFPLQDDPGKVNYFKAFEELKKMLTGEKPLSLERAVYLSEQAYDPSLSFEDFDSQINKAVSVIGLKMEKDKISPSDNIGKIMTTFKYMADTISVRTKQETNITTYPKTYDFEDFWGRNDYRKMFVSKLMKEGSGQCHSLPLLFLILSEKIGAKANLAFAPNHSFIKFTDKRGKWHNIELTNGMLASDHFMIESGYIKAEAMQSKIFLEPLSKKETIGQCFNDLALGYIKEYGYDSFVTVCTNAALNTNPNNLTAHQINANYFMTLGNYIGYQYKEKGLTKQQLDQDNEAQKVFTSAKGAIKRIENLGYAEMPPEAYEAWLKSIQKESFKQQHNNEIKILGGMIELKK